MYFCGLNKTTLLDYPEHLACTVFLGGCNFRCPYCQNKDLILHPADYATHTEEEILDHLKKRAGILSGVCITGGEPTLQAELPDLIRKCKDLGYLVKLDTNGTNPEMLRDVCENGLVDYVAMDIKSSQEGYAKAAGLSDPGPGGDLLAKVKESVSFLMDTPHRPGFDFEFRTTVVRELHDAQTLSKIADWISGAPHYFLQSYRESEGVLVPGFSAYETKELEGFIALIKDRIPSAALRGES